MEAKVFEINGTESKEKISLNDAVFGVEPNEHAMYLDVKLILANRRQGTHKSKERAEISGSTRKIKKQKGTGTARAGSIKSPVFRGGGRVFGPRVRDYGFKVNKKVKQLARRSALSSKMNDKAITIVTDFTFDAPKTKTGISMLGNFKVENNRSLVVTAERDMNVELSMRNVPRTTYMVANELNTYEILKAKHVFMTKSAAESIQNLLS